MGFIKAILEFLNGSAEMTITITRNPGDLTHQDGCGGAVTLTIGPAEKSTVVCSRCGTKAEFDSIYATISIYYSKEDGAPRDFPFFLYRDGQVVKGRLYVTPAPPAH